MSNNNDNKKGGFQSTKRRSHSTPELHMNASSTATSDEEVQKMFSLLSSLTNGGSTNDSSTVTEGTASQSGVSYCAVQDSDHNKNAYDTGINASNISPMKSSLFVRGCNKLTYLLSRKSRSVDDTCKLDNNNSGDLTYESVGRDTDSPDFRRRGSRRSKSISGCMFRRLKKASKLKASNSDDTSDSSSSDEPERFCTTDGSPSKKTAAVECEDVEALKLDDSKDAGANTRDLQVLSCNESGAEVSNSNNSPITAAVSSGASVHQPLAQNTRPLQNASGPSHQINRIPQFQQVVGTQSQTHTTQNIYAHFDSLTENGTFSHRTVHTQIDYMHCLVPDQWGILNAPYYWGQIDRFQADALLEGKPEGCFILRDSSQEEFVFSVSFRRYGRTLHARIEQWNHKFTFDAHDTGVFSSETVCNLLKRYKDPNLCMFFEPMLTLPLLKKNPQSLRELCRARVCSHMKYDDISMLKLPIVLREYLRVYHYKQRLRVRRMEVDGFIMTDNHPGGVVTNTCLSPVTLSSINNA